MTKNPKMVICRNCNTPIAAAARICPACGAKNKKPFYKRIWFILLVVIIAAGVIGSFRKDSGKEEKREQTNTEFDDYSYMTEQVTERPVYEDISSTGDAEPDTVEETEQTKEEETPAAEDEEQTAVTETEKAEEEGTAAAEDTEQDPEAEPEVTQSDDGAVDPDFKAAMDSYETFMDEYIAFMKKYKDNPDDMGLLADYADYMGKYTKFASDFEKWGNESMNAAETAYYVEVQTRVSKKLLEVTQ